MVRLFDLVENQAAERPGSIMLASKIKGAWRTLTYKDILQQSRNFAASLIDLGIESNELTPDKMEKIALISPNRPEWVIADLAVQQAGAILTPIYPTVSPSDFAYILNEAEVKIVIFANEELYERFKPVFDRIPTLKHIYSFDEVEGITNWKSLQATTDGEEKRKVICNNITPETIATIIYTSGTTGSPKGVMLSHNNIASNVEDCMPVFHFAKTGDRALSFLPLNHIFEKMITYIYIRAGLSIYYAESMDTIGDNLKEVKPMVFTCVPRLLEKVYEKIMAKGLELKGIKRALFFWALELGKKYDNVNRGSLWYRIQLHIANKLIFNKWREALGGRVEAVVSGSAPLQSKLIKMFTAANITIMEGYGLTETSPVISVNLLESEGRRIGTVGLPIRNVEVKILDDGEIICRGPNVMMGYYKKPEMTKEVLTEDGWLHTGDIGEWIEGKFLKITDRKKEMFKTSGGKYVAPQVIENKMRESPFIEQIMVIGAGRKFVSALIIPSFSQIRDKFTQDGVALSGVNNELIKDQKVIDFLQKQVEKYNSFFGHVEQVKKFTLLPAEWTVDNGALTPKLSLRRKIVEQQFEKLIDEMYQ